MATAKTNCSEVPENTDVVKKFSQPWGSKLAFDGVPAECITEHPDFEALTNEMVLQQVCPLLNDRKGGFLPTGVKMLRTSKYNHKAHKSKKPNLHLRGNYRMHWYFFSYDCNSVLS